MNTLDDLRNTLNREAGAAPRGEHAELARVARRKARQHQQRQRAAAAFVAVAAIGTAGVVASLPNRSTDTPVAQQVFGIDVPQSKNSLGWTYDLADVTTAEGDGRVEVRIPSSDTPTLVSWATRGGDDAVTVQVPGEVPYESSAADFADFVWVSPGTRGAVTVEGADPGLAVAVYSLDEDETPAGVGDGDGPFFRQHVAGRTLLSAAVGDRGETRLEVEVDVPADKDPRIGLAHSCFDAPQGTQVHVGVAGEDGSMVWGACQGDEFDAGGSISSSFEKGEFAGQTVTFQMWLTRDDVELTADDAREARIGLGVYLVNESSVTAAGQQFDEVMESRGRTWQLAEHVTGKPTELRLDIPRDGGTYMVAGSSDGKATYRVLADGELLDEVVNMGGSGAFGEVLLPHTARQVVLAMSKTTGTEAVLVLYRME